MQGWMFITINPNGSLGVSGAVIREITTEKFLCRFFLGPTSHSRVVTIAELESYHLFQTQDEMDSYVDTLRQRAEAEPQQPGGAVNPETPDGDPPPAVTPGPPANKRPSRKQKGKGKTVHPKGKPTKPAGNDFLDD